MIEAPLYWSAPRRTSSPRRLQGVPAHRHLAPHAGADCRDGGWAGVPLDRVVGELPVHDRLAASPPRSGPRCDEARGTGASRCASSSWCGRIIHALVRPGDYPAAVAACASRLGERADAYGSAAVAEDLRAVLKAIHLRKIDLYGDVWSYEAQQVFAVHYPRFVRDLVLDGTYDQRFDPLEPGKPVAVALRRAWDTMCTSFPGCRHDELVHDIASFYGRLARHPIVGVADDQSSMRRHFDLTADAFAQLVGDATYSYTFFRDLPAALVAVRHHDLVPIERLAAEDVSLDAAGGAPSAYSAGDLEAVSCHDYPTAWDTRSTDVRRAAELAHAVRRLRARAFFPFPKRVWLSSLDENELVYGCLRWPRPTVSNPAFPPELHFRRIPVLVLDGLLDQATPLGDARRVATAWPDATFVRVANSNHVTAQADFLHCVSVITRRYLSRGTAGDTGCARRVPAQYVVPAFPKNLARSPEADPAGRDDDSTKLDRQTAWVTTETVGDALERWYNLLAGRTGHGLYGGSFSVSGGYYSYGPLVLHFHASRFVPDLGVSGTVTWDRRSSVIRGTLTVTGPRGLSGHLRIKWVTDERAPTATEQGTINQRHVTLKMPATYSAHG